MKYCECICVKKKREKEEKKYVPVICLLTCNKIHTQDLLYLVSPNIKGLQPFLNCYLSIHQARLGEPSHSLTPEATYLSRLN